MLSFDYEVTAIICAPVYIVLLRKLYPELENFVANVSSAFEVTSSVKNRGKVSYRKKGIK